MSSLNLGPEVRNLMPEGWEEGRVRVPGFEAGGI